MSKILILQGFIGSGKDFAASKLQEHGIEKMVGYTTRTMRIGELNGREYNFITKQKYFEMDAKKPFVAKRTAFTGVGDSRDIDYYGLSLSSVDSNKKQCVILDHLGTSQLIEALGEENCFVVRLKCDDEVILQRAKDRGDNLVEVGERLENDKVMFDLHPTKTCFYEYIELDTTTGTEQYVDYIVKKMEEFNG